MRDDRRGSCTGYADSAALRFLKHAPHVRTAHIDADLTLNLKDDELNAPRRAVPSVVTWAPSGQSWQERHNFIPAWQTIVAAPTLGQPLDSILTEARNRSVHMRWGMPRRTRNAASRRPGPHEHQQDVRSIPLAAVLRQIPHVLKLLFGFRDPICNASVQGGTSVSSASKQPQRITWVPLCPIRDQSQWISVESHPLARSAKSGRM